MKPLPVVMGILLTFACPVSLSQNLSLGIGGGPAFVLDRAPGGGFARDISNNGLGFGLSYAIGGKAELSFRDFPISLSGRVSYVAMSGSGTVTNPGLYPGGPGYLETSLHLWSLGVGGEWTISQGPVAPFIGANVLLESFSNLSQRMTNSAGTADYLHGRGTARGFGLEIGARLNLTPAMRLDLSGMYSLHSLFDTDHPRFATLGVSAEVLFAVF